MKQMKCAIYAIVIMMLYSFNPPDGFYNLSFRTIDGTRIDMKDFYGKKILFVTLPLSEQDTTIKVSDMESLQKKYESSLVIIGVIASDAGFKDEDKASVKNLYKKMHPGFIITEGMKTKKSAGAEQAPIFQWLTNKDKNRHFDYEARNVGYKFFVDETGDLYAVIGPEMKLFHPAVDRILTKPLPKKK